MSPDPPCLRMFACSSLVHSCENALRGSCSLCVLKVDTCPDPSPCGLSSYSVPLAVPQRAVSTAEPRPRKLPPITDSHFRPGNRKVHSNTARPRPAENSAWAKKWATQRSQYSSICDSPVRASRCASSTVPQTPYSGVRPSGRKKEIANPSEKDAAIIKRLHGIYGNRTDRVSRAEKLRESLGNFQKRIMHNEINTSLRNYAKKVEEDKKSRRELKRVRDRYTRDKERRSRHSFISLNALEAPQVPRKAYGLPDEGQELQDTSNITRKTRSELKNIWQKSMRRIALVQGLVKLSPEKNDKRIPNIKPPGKRSSQKGN